MDIDLDSQKSQRGQILKALNVEFGEDRVLNIATFGTIGSRSSITSACRGLGIDESEALYLTGLVPEERGAN
jgi:DNA polymerase-3 subunit alpha